MPLVANTENISLFFHGLALVTWSSLAMDVRLRKVPPGSRSSRTVFPPTAESKTTKRSRRRRTPLSMKPQTTVLINREATKHDVDKWMEDLFGRRCVGCTDARLWSWLSGEQAELFPL